MYFSFALFRNDIRESIVFQTLGRVTFATNTGAALARGIEIDWRFGMFGWVTVSGNLTFLETEIGGGTPLPLPLLPPQKALLLNTGQPSP